MRHFSVKITQGGRFLEYSAIARSSSQALADAMSHLLQDVPFTISVI